MFKALGRLIDLLAAIRFFVTLMGLVGWLYIAAIIAQGRPQELRLRGMELVAGMKAAAEKANELLQDHESWELIEDGLSSDEPATSVDTTHGWKY